MPPICHEFATGLPPEMPPSNPIEGKVFGREKIKKQIPPTHISRWNDLREVINPSERNTHWGIPKSGSVHAEIYWHDCDVGVAFQVATGWQSGGMVAIKQTSFCDVAGLPVAVSKLSYLFQE